MQLICPVVFLAYFVKTSVQITNSSKVKSDKTYMVYLLQKPQSRGPNTVDYDNWTCGGVIIHPLYILTSATCLADVEFAYVISGYRKYVSARQLETDECLRRKKKRIIAHCEMQTEEYNVVDFYNSTTWTQFDLATARVDTPFEFHDDSYITYCSYKPTMIKVNYLKKYEAPGTVAVALGWGHTRYFRGLNDTKDYNQEDLHYTSTVIENKTTCAQVWQDRFNLPKSFTYLMLCTYGAGNVDENGVPTNYVPLWKNYNDTYKVSSSIYYSWNRRHLEYLEQTRDKKVVRKQYDYQEQEGLTDYNVPDDAPDDIQEYNRPHVRDGEDTTPSVETTEKIDATINPTTEAPKTTEVPTTTEAAITTTEAAITTTEAAKTTTEALMTTEAPQTTEVPKTTEAPKTTTEALITSTEASQTTTAALQTTAASEKPTDSQTNTPGTATETSKATSVEITTTGAPQTRSKLGKITEFGPSLGNGICQNDHGGPLVTWIGGHETVVGVASGFIVTSRLECKGPFLFSSTACANQLIRCTVAKKERRRTMGCDDFGDQGYKIVEKEISWNNPEDATKPAFRTDDADAKPYNYLDDLYEDAANYEI